MLAQPASLSNSTGNYVHFRVHSLPRPDFRSQHLNDSSLLPTKLDFFGLDEKIVQLDEQNERSVGG